MIFRLIMFFKEDSTELQKDNTSSCSSAEQIVRDAISQDSIVIFSKTYCPYCNLAKGVFDKLDKPYKSIELDSREDGDQIQRYLGEMTGAKTVPRVFVNGECLGGGTDIQNLYETGRLQNILDRGSKHK